MLSSCVSFFGKKNQTFLQHKSQPKYLKFSLPSRGEFRPLSVTGNTTALRKEKTNLEGAKTGVLEGVLFGFGLGQERENSDDIIADLSEQECLEFLKDLHATETRMKDDEEKEQGEEVTEVASGDKGTQKPHQRTAKEEEEFQKRVERQIELEVSARANAANKYQQLLEQLHQRRIGANLKPAEALTVCWFQPLVKAIEEEHKAIMEKEAGVDRSAYGPYFISLSPAKLAVIAIHDLVSLLLSDPQGVSFTSAASTIGSSVHAEVCFEKLQKKTKLIKRLKLSGPLTTARINKYSKKALESEEWSTKMLVKVGAVLVKLLVETAQIPSFVQERLQMIEESATSDHSRIRFKPIKLTPSHLLNTNNTFAFSHQEEKVEGKRKKVGKIVCDNWVMEFIFQEHKLREMVNVRYLPMCLPPNPWKGIKKGIYYHPQSEVSLMRFKSWPKQVLVLQEAHEKKKLSSLYHGLNLLSSVPWKINSPVFTTVKHAWDLGGGIADLPSKTNQPHPPKPSDFDGNETAKKNWWNQIKKIDRHNQDLHSLRCDTNLKLKVASEFLSEKEIFFPHNIDFRGRCYPIPPHLNHMGSDLCRGILSFANGKPLGQKGLYWLMIQLASLKGMDKISFEQREEYTKKNLNNIMDSARNPLGGERWWLQSDDPWQTLATCCEIALAIESKDPSLFVSSLPVHQDGSCNGLQHYAALGGDYLGAVSVNLVPNNTPQDVYSQVAQLVSKMVKEDAEMENLEIAKLLDGRVERKIVKQTIMTSVYGVTFVGARQQIRNAIKDRKLFEDDATIIEASLYLTKKTFSALREMFLGAREIMDWFTKCAQIIGKQKGQPTEWTTPLHLPVVQPYGKSKATIIKTVVQNVALPSVGEKKVTVGRQKSAFPPNYIHSLDSTHMFFTAFECAEKGITFAAVHDSFWTHACDVDEMNRILRKQFVRLHQMDLLGQLKAEFEQRYPDLVFPDLPKKGDLDLKQVLKSPYFFH